MNNVHNTYAPPRLLALALGLAVFVIYQGWWREGLVGFLQYGTPVPLGFAIGFSMIIGYGLAMLWWLIRQTRGQVIATFRPTRGRILGALALGAVAPVAVFSWVPWITIGFAVALLGHEPHIALLVWLVPSLLAYPLSAMIIRHTYERWRLRLGLFCLVFWTAYSIQMLWHGVMIFRL